LNEALHRAFQARDAHAFALCDDFVRNFDKCLQDRILALARGETHDVLVCVLIKFITLIATNAARVMSVCPEQA
jgi:hypothetical protein